MSNPLIERAICVSFVSMLCFHRRGLLVFVGITSSDTEEDSEYIVRKVLNTRLFSDDQGKAWKCSVVSKQLEILFVSQFTLFGIANGNKLDFHKAMSPGPAKSMYDNLVRGWVIGDAIDSYAETIIITIVIIVIIIVTDPPLGPIVCRSPGRKRITRLTKSRTECSEHTCTSIYRTMDPLHSG